MLSVPDYFLATHEAVLKTLSMLKDDQLYFNKATGVVEGYRSIELATEAAHRRTHIESRLGELSEWCSSLATISWKVGGCTG